MKSNVDFDMISISLEALFFPTKGPLLNGYIYFLSSLLQFIHMINFYNDNTVKNSILYVFLFFLLSAAGECLSTWLPEATLTPLHDTLLSDGEKNNASFRLHCLLWRTASLLLHVECLLIDLMNGPTGRAGFFWLWIVMIYEWIRGLFGIICPESMWLFVVLHALMINLF